MKTKIIPFDLETATKIQAGEVEGKIKYSESDGYAYNAEIVKFDLIADKFKAKPNSTLFRTIVAVVDFDNHQGIRTFNTDGYGCNHNGDDTKLFIEVPDNEPMFNVGDTVSINIINSSYDADFRARYHSKLATVLFTNKYGAGVKTIISGDENYFSFNELIFVRRNTKEPQFKPFDKVLVRNKKEYPTTWHAELFSHILHDRDLNDQYVGIGGVWDECISYAGNEHLVGTTNKPTEE